MKRLFLLMTLIATLAGRAGAAENIVFIDLERVFNEFYKTALAKSQVEVQQADIEKERTVLVDEMKIIEEAVDTFKKEARDTTLSEDIRDGKRILYEERLLELREKQKSIADFMDRRQKQLQIQVTRMSQTIMDEIRQTIIAYAKREGLLAVIDSSSRQAAVGIFIYTHPDIDITDTILTVLNSKRPELETEEEKPASEQPEEEQEPRKNEGES
jgi:Skp family chaperone for outer membrane proteins